MPSPLNLRKVGDGPRYYAVWLDTWPVFLDGLEGVPHIGDRFEIDGQFWRVVEIYEGASHSAIKFDSVRGSSHISVKLVEVLSKLGIYAPPSRRSCNGLRHPIRGFLQRRRKALQLQAVALNS